LNEEKTAIKPNIKAERNTVILRDIPSDTKEEEVCKLELKFLFHVLETASYWLC
jgi:hypothetical protein